jgi:hypothetical protein
MGFVNTGSQTLFSCNYDLHAIAQNREGRTSRCVHTGVIAVDTLSSEQGLLAVLDGSGTVSVLQVADDATEHLCNVVLLGDVYSGDLVTNGDLIYSKDSSLLILLRNDVLSIYSLIGLENDAIIATILAEHRFDHFDGFCSLWGTADSPVIACSGYSSDLTTIRLQRDPSVETESEWRVISHTASSDNIAPSAAVEVPTKHEAWITSLSKVSAGYCEISATGDCNGTIIIWRAVPIPPDVMRRTGSIDIVAEAEPTTEVETNAHGSADVVVGRRGRTVSIDSAALGGAQSDTAAEGTPFVTAEREVNTARR